ncbi:hypothetical protein SADUNF_Sadunf08G0115200 [Salix dunnii]|uniref:Helicase C-terminal domain-containing protein n=1 Tax=Salix dunnii TaxID=1413687 RepID=A0A835MU16_9ROSI|nr:hypothetical protein SADUNF_Sadunf08G0115200 [Salix dunnii]
MDEKKGTLSYKYVMLSAKSRDSPGYNSLVPASVGSQLEGLLFFLSDVPSNGSTQVMGRQNIVDAFNNGTSKACLLSTRAGGQGLNLTGAGAVTIPGLDFNPQIDRQAEDHCRRIGQTKPVTIYRMVTKGTVDENVNAMAKWKLVLVAAVLENYGGDLIITYDGIEILSKLTETCPRTFSCLFWRCIQSVIKGSSVLSDQESIALKFYFTFRYFYDIHCCISYARPGGELVYNLYF